MKRRVDMFGNQSELAMVKGQYGSHVEEHLGVSNRNRMKVGLDGTEPLIIGQHVSAGRVSFNS